MQVITFFKIGAQTNEYNANTAHLDFALKY